MVANPGCYPTSVQLPLVPLLEQGLISHEDIIIDAKSGGWRRACQGAGKAAADDRLLFLRAWLSNGARSRRHATRWALSPPPSQPAGISGAGRSAKQNLLYAEVGLDGWGWGLELCRREVGGGRGMRWGQPLLARTSLLSAQGWPRCDTQ